MDKRDVESGVIGVQNIFDELASGLKENEPCAMTCIVVKKKGNIYFDNIKVIGDVEDGS